MRCIYEIVCPGGVRKGNICLIGCPTICDHPDPGTCERKLVSFGCDVGDEWDRTSCFKRVKYLEE